MSWILRLSIDRDEAELALSQLWAGGATGVSDEAIGDDISIIAGFATEGDARRAAEALAIHEPVVADDIATWDGPQETVHDVAGRQLVVSSGQAFGHGHHPTTTLLLNWLGDLELGGRSVLDVGTGTGILAFAALAHGAVDVIGVDNDPAAIEVAALNQTRNDLAFDLSDTPIQSLNRSCDVVLSNMLLPHQLSVANDLVRLTRTTLLIAGILSEQVEPLAAALDPLVLVETRRHDDWRALRLDRP